MKTLFFFLLSTVLLVQKFTNGLPNHGLATEVLADKDKMPELYKFQSFIIEELLNAANYAVQGHSTFFKKVIEEAEKSKLDLSKELKEMKDLIEKIESLDKIKDDSLLPKTIGLFKEALEITQDYDLEVNKEPTEEQKAIAKIFEEINNDNLQDGYMENLKSMRPQIIAKTEAFINSLSEDEKKKQEKIVNWFQRLQDEKDSEKGFKIMLEFFSLIE